MGVETRRAAAAGRHKKQPPIFSHEFVIQNHGDIASAVLMIFILGLMFPLTSDLASVFILPQYNETVPTVTETGAAGEMTVYRSGQRDCYTMFFYTVVMIVFHAVVQEYILDKLQRKVHLSKVKMFKFTESGHQVIFALASVIFGGYVIQEILQHDWDIKKLWVDYPEAHRLMTIQLKFYAMIQIAYWLHQFPEFYFQKFKMDEIRQRAFPSMIYIVLVGAAYFLNFTRFAIVLLTFEYIQQVVFHTARLAHFLEKKSVAQTLFRAWNFVFVAVRLASAVLTFVTFWYGLKQSEVVNIDVQAGNFNTSLVRLNAILFLLGLQLYQVYNFMSFHVHRYKERSGKGKKDKKTSHHQVPQKKSKKTDESESEDTSSSSPQKSPAEPKKKNKKD